MSRAIAALALTIVLALGGCLRNKYDLCGEVNPHPECDAGAAPRDAGSDAGSDAAAEDPGMIDDSDAGPEPDGGAGEDGGPEDAGTGEDGGADAAD